MNGPLMVMPGSHKGPTYDQFRRLLLRRDVGRRRRGSAKSRLFEAVKLTGEAGDMTIHHVRMVHGSAMNQSNRQRRLLLHEYTAGDVAPCRPQRRI